MTMQFIHSSLKLALAAALLTSAAQAEPFSYFFSGTITSSMSFNPNYSEAYLNSVFGGRAVSYVFNIDFERDTSTYTNSAATWYYFFNDLIGDGVARSSLGGLAGETQTGFNGFFNAFHNIGELDGGQSVRISTNSDITANWEVENWTVGQFFQFQDLTIPQPNTGGAVYLLGQVTLINIAAIPEPSSTALLTGFMAAGVAASRRRFRPRLQPLGK